MQRREFFKLSAMAGLATVLAPAANAFQIPDPAKKAVLNLSFQEGVAYGNSLNEKLDFCEANGVVGFEPGGGGLAKRVDEFKKALSGRKVKISAICAGFSGVPMSDDPKVRRQAIDSIKEIVTAAGELGSTGVIMVPAFNGQTKLGNQEGRKIMVEEVLPELGEHAVKCGTHVILEPLNRGEAYFLRQVADGAAICKDVKNPGVALMGDFWHMTWEETSDFAAFVAGAKWLWHVHMASRKKRRIPGEDGDADNYIDGFRGLKAIGYQHYVSFECGCGGDRKTLLQNACKLLREQWEQA
ncbi:MAG: sugar phosphate isomerase/epimerase [Verrucomicrobia bacterium]|nr:sugar phosphate isomerase/epimerase [Verrucomicrobiota bacterium]